MNAVEIEEAISLLAEQDFDSVSFPYAFLEAFGNKPATIKRLKTGNTNSSDIEGGVLQRNNIHIATCSEGTVSETLTQLKESPATAKGKAKFVVATDGIDFEAEDLTSDDPPVVCRFNEFPDHFGFFLPLAGITTVKQIRESSFDIKATGRLNRLYIELLKDNPEWGTEERRHDMNHFMARLIFCFFAEDTDIFNGEGLFTKTIEQMSERDSSNTHEIMSEVFRALDTSIEDRAGANLPRWADTFPYVNGGLFSGNTDVPRFSKIARSYLIHIGNLDWTKINPDIFGSMIQAVTDEEERGVLGLHYTSVPNILKVLNPLFLDDLRAKFEEAGDSPQKLLNLRKRMAKIRVFDPACGSGNFLVISYKEMRAIEAEINQRRGESGRKSDIPLTNYRGIELRDFPAEIARLALIIAEYQCDVLYRGQKEALAEFLPLDAMNWIICGNALRLDWLGVCPPTGTGVKLKSDDLFSTPLDQVEIDFENEGGETYICGNPPYIGATQKAPKGASKEMKERLKKEDALRKADLSAIFGHRSKTWKSLDYVAGWFMKAADYGTKTNATTAFVSTNSICQGSQVPSLWPLIFNSGHEIDFAYTSFRWKNLASHNAGVTVVIVGISNSSKNIRRLYSVESDGTASLKKVENINAYLVAGKNTVVHKATSPLCNQADIDYGNKPTDGGGLILSSSEVGNILSVTPTASKFIRRFVGSSDGIDGKLRFCIWISDEDLNEANQIPTISSRIKSVAAYREDSPKLATVASAKWPHRFQEVRQKGNEIPVIVPRHSSENRDYLPFALSERGTIVADSAFAFYSAEWWNIAILASKLHLVWVATVCGKIKTDYRFSNTLGWNTLPIPKLTEKNKEDLTKCAEDILLAREAHFPATIADLYDPENMPDNLRRAHERNDEVLERIYIGRKFKNDTERLEKLFDLYTKMTKSTSNSKKKVS